jgi:hypothetical protein
MKRFWRYTVRYGLARMLIELGVLVWPPGPARDEVIELLSRWRRGMELEVARRREASPR